LGAWIQIPQALVAQLHAPPNANESPLKEAHGRFPISIAGASAKSKAIRAQI
jgi:hypothetical protein